MARRRHADHSAPRRSTLSKSHEFVANTFGDTARSLGPALNVNTLGEVPDSSWFTNRIGRSDMTVDEVLRGPIRSMARPPGVWDVTGRPVAGITPKFTIRDARGDTYMLKFDPATNPELPSSVELISTKLFHAIGYHVPEDFIVTFTEDRLRVAPGARCAIATGEPSTHQPSRAEAGCGALPRRADGSIRALASRWVPGNVVGQFKYTGRRPDDPNDLFPHERRRELRGMRVFAAWLNHDDARAINSIDTYVEDGGRRYIRHYMQDFGSNLGSGSTSAQQPRGGYEYLIERGKIGKGMVGFGLYQRDWMGIKWPDDPSIGNIEAEVFDPATWKTEYPNPAFQQLDAADAFWAASIMSRFTDTMIRAVVEEARLSNPDAAAYLARRHHQAARQDRALGRHGDQPRRSLHVAPGRRRSWPSTTSPSGSASPPGAPLHRPLVAVRQPRRHAAGAQRARSTPNACARRFPPTSGGRRMPPASGMPSRPSRPPTPQFSHWARRSW